MGKTAGHRRDRRRPARRRHRDRRCAVRASSASVYMGEEDTQPAGAQRGPDAAARRRGHPGDHRLAHPQGRDQRGAPRLGDQRRAPRTTAFGTVAGPHPFPAHGARLRSGSSATRPARRCWSAPAAARRGAAPASAAGPTRSASSTRSSPTPTCALDRLRGRRRRRRHRTARGDASPPVRPACCTARAPTCCRTRTARPSSRTRSRPASTTRASGPSTPTCTTSAGPTYRAGHRRRGDGRVRACSAAPRASSRRSSRARAGRRARRSAGSSGRTAILLVNLSGRGDKDVETASKYFGIPT